MNGMPLPAKASSSAAAPQGGEAHAILAQLESESKALPAYPATWHSTVSLQQKRDEYEKYLRETGLLELVGRHLTPHH
jgi:hypothetical protein